MEFNRKELKQVLDLIKPGLGSDDQMEHADLIIFTEKGIAAYNDRVLVHSKDMTFPFEAGGVDASKLSQWLGKVKSEMVDLEYDDNSETLVASSGKSNIHLKIVDPSNYEALAAVLTKVNKPKPIPKGLLDMMDLARVCCSKNKNEVALRCIKVDSDGSVLASDNFRAIVAESKQKTGFKSFLIPADNVKQVVKFAPVKMQLLDGWIAFIDSTEAVYACRIYPADEFPDISRVIVGEGGRELNLPTHFSDVIKRAQIFAEAEEESDTFVQVDVNPRGIIVSADCDAGRFQESIEYIGNEQMSFSIHPKLLTGIADKTTTCEVGDNLIKLKSDNWVCVICLAV